MYVRTAYVTGDPAKIEDALESWRTEGLELVSAQPGYRGFGLFADRELGKLVMDGWWDSEAARQRSDGVLRERRAALLQPFARTVTIDNWEAVVFRAAPRIEPGAGFRMSRFDFDPSLTDPLIQAFQLRTLPLLKRIAGFAGVSLLVDRAKGRGTVGVVYADRAALAASRGPQSEVRGEVAPKSGLTMRSVEEFEVVTVDRPGA